MSALLTPELLRKADQFLDNEQQHRDASDLGEFFFKEFGSDKEQTSSQVRSLQQTATSAMRFADIEDFVKNQMGRKSGTYKKWRQVGDETLRQLTVLRKAAEGMVSDESLRLLLRLHLARGWVRALVGAYLYAKAHNEMERTHA